MSNSSQFQIEQNQVLQAYLDKIFDYWRLEPEKRDPLKSNAPFEMFLEIFITSSCNQKCSYCYLTNYGDSLYPPEIRDKNLILKNLKILFDYLIEQKVHLNRVDFFSGEIWTTPFGNAVFDLTLWYLENTDLKIDSIIIPTNFSFCMTLDGMKVMDNYIRKFKAAHCLLQLSCSIDGIIVDNLNRPLNTEKEKTFDFYSNVLSFCKKHDYGYHPMIAAANIEYQKENYDMWVKVLDEMYDGDKTKTFGSVMQLEVRNDDWTDDKIIEYCKWLNYIIEKDKKHYFGNDEELFRRYMLHGTTFFGRFQSSYNPYRLLPSSDNESHLSHCTIGTMLCVRLGDLALCPCHRTAYEKFLFGKFIVKDNKIIGVEANNIPLLNSTYRSSYALKPKCDCCEFESYCLRGCLGSQYENTGDIHYPVESVCEHQKAKIIFLFEKANKLNYFQEIDKNFPLQKVYSQYQKIKNTKEYQKWAPIIQQII